VQAIFNVIKHHGFEDVILYDQNLLELAELLETLVSIATKSE